MKTKESNDRVLTLLRQKQYNLNIHYLTTDSSAYKFLSVVTYLFGIVASIISLFIILGIKGRNDATKGYNFEDGHMPDHVREQLAESDKWITYLSIILVIFFVGLILRAFKRNFIPYLISLVLMVVSGGILISMFYLDLQETINQASNTSFIWKNLVPIGGTLFFAVISAIIAFRQFYKDKKGCDQIEAYIYKKYSAIAADLSEDDWQAAVDGFEMTSNRKKASKKDDTENNNEV